MKSRLIAFAIVTLIAAAISCNAPLDEPLPTIAPTNTLAPQPQVDSSPLPPTATSASFAEATATVPAPSPAGLQHGSVIFESDLSVGWAAVEVDNGRGTPVESGYQIAVTPSESFGFWIYTTQIDEKNFYAEVTASAQDCPSEQGSYGILFHYQDDNRFRFFVINCNGSYTLFDRVDPSTAIPLVSGELPDDIDPIVGEHSLGVRALDTSLTVYVDGQEMANIPSSEALRGDIGLYVQSNAAPASATFTQLSIYQP